MKINAQIVARFIEEVINQNNMDSAATFVREDFVEHIPFPGQGPGIEGLKDVLRGMRSAFPDIRWEILEQIEDGEKVLTRFEWHGSHNGVFLGIPPSGKKVVVWGVVLDRVVEGKLKESRLLMDTLGLMTQLGVFPPPHRLG